MIACTLTTHSGASILICEVTETVEKLLSLSKNLSDNAVYQSLKTDKRRKEYLATRLALKQLVGIETDIIYDQNGKPSLSDHSKFVSISHSGKWVAVMTHENKPCGIDIECPTDKFEHLYTRFLSKEEQNYLKENEDLMKVQIAWSAKEALYKIIGPEAVNFADQLKILPFDKSSGHLLAEHVPTQRQYKLFFKCNADYNLVYCTD